MKNNYFKVTLIVKLDMLSQTLLNLILKSDVITYVIYLFLSFAFSIKIKELCNMHNVYLMQVIL